MERINPFNVVGVSPALYKRNAVQFNFILDPTNQLQVLGFFKLNKLMRSAGCRFVSVPCRVGTYQKPVLN